MASQPGVDRDGTAAVKTRLGLFVRGVTRTAAWRPAWASTRRASTPGLRAGLRHRRLAGCALSQIGNVGPDLGQGYIVDAFMVVVLGGVGQLARHRLRGLGPGRAVNKLLEGWQGAVLAKIAVLLLLVSSKASAGLFAQKGGRSMKRILLIAAALLVRLLPLLHLLILSPQARPCTQEFYVSLLGKFLCYAICALALDLIWGFGGILSLGPGCSSRSVAMAWGCT